MSDELWKPVRDFEDFYEVSNHGRVRSLDRRVMFQTRWGGAVPRLHKGCILAPGTKPAGYKFVGLSNGSTTTYRMVHCMVAEAFIGPRPPGYDVGHDDNNKSNNHVSNLKYQTHHENILDRKRHGVERAGETVPTSRLTEAEVRLIREGYEAGVGRTQLARRFGVKPGQIYRIVTRRQWAHI